MRLGHMRVSTRDAYLLSAQIQRCPNYRRQGTKFNAVCFAPCPLAALHLHCLRLVPDSRRGACTPRRRTKARQPHALHPGDVLGLPFLTVAVPILCVRREVPRAQVTAGHQLVTLQAILHAWVSVNTHAQRYATRQQVAAGHQLVTLQALLHACISVNTHTA